MDGLIYQQIIEKVAAFATADRPIYLVGGAVRDMLLQRPNHDLDFTMSGPTRALAKKIADQLNGALFVMDEERDTCRVILITAEQECLLLDFASLRKPNLEDDLRARDFTINAIALDVNRPEQLIDPLKGAVDLREGLIRACSETSMVDDPARVLRGVRLAVGLNYRIDSHTLAQMRAAAPLLTKVSPERQRDELFKMLGNSRVAQAIRVLDQTGALRMVLPEMEAMKGAAQPIPPVLDAFDHSLSTARYLEEIMGVLVEPFEEGKGADLLTGLAVLRLGRFRERLAKYFEAGEVNERSTRALLFMAALYYDIAKPLTQDEDRSDNHPSKDHNKQGAFIAAARGRALALSSNEVQRLEKWVLYHNRVHFLASQRLADPCALNRRVIYRYFSDLREAGVALCLLSLADLRAAYQAALSQELWLAELDTCRTLLESYWEFYEEVISPPRVLTGKDLIDAFDLTPGPVIGRLVEAIREEQAAGEISSREEALAFAAKWLENPEVIRGDEEGQNGV